MVNLKEAFHDLNLKRKIFFDDVLEESELNIMEIEILIFLKEYPRSNTFTEIMKSKGYAKSYISKAISNLVEKEYIRKQSMEYNKKSFQFYLLPKSEMVIREYEKCVEAFRDIAFKNISDEELQIFETIMCKMINNVTED